MELLNAVRQPQSRVAAAKVKLIHGIWAATSALFAWLINQVTALFAWLINHQPVVLFSQNKPTSSN
jgi:hypothetical protein